MYGFATEHLQDTFAQVAFEHLNALLFKIGIEFTLFGEHRFAFYKVLHLVLVKNVSHDLAIFVGILGPMHNGTIARSVFFELK